MFCVRNIQRSCQSTKQPALLVARILRARYSRRSDKSTSSYKLVASRNDALDETENNAILGIDSNWELLTPRGFRFYLPGSIGPGWLDATTTAQVEVQSVLVPNEIEDIEIARSNVNKRKNILNVPEVYSVLHCHSQECPTLLRKDILELFPGCLEVASPQLTIITISQKTNNKNSRWSKELETERLAQYFVLAASDVCKKLKMCGYWADFINPFSGQPYSNQKNNVLYQTDERFRSVGFKVEKKQNCKVITHDNDSQNFIGNLYTTAPANTEFLKEIMSNINNKIE
ncbi:methylmalonic aciduria and homocystinuria type D homolog, mitochondrial [Trichogramma pretiosum]|uniref:methylmalonic aciduria and homocystinuria type D homolog, mitochondrial n=1 Tax=Trichogramma pretiosum TaxID=7493 RepID=UPI0006C98739|nr:methylmalonic aciduria and homocystinuria type D homolog, mitochondrial [Trichogramma pretiosum]XP_014231912.1 methylmalonic aciduria and homocystinuria type D homolog, mitochondrial [Trichogramma pretiosum]XP_023316983.1 methylmalonic aciduria and homocystinuria type D homolog, mitochondrial [Trichogramma pretiosum]